MRTSNIHGQGSTFESFAICDSLIPAGINFAMAELEKYGVVRCQCNVEKLKQSEEVIDPGIFEAEAGPKKRKVAG